MRSTHASDMERRSEDPADAICAPIPSGIFFVCRQGAPPLRFEHGYGNLLDQNSQGCGS